MDGRFRGARSTAEEVASLLVATNRPEERDCLCAWGASVGLRARVIPSHAFCRPTGDEGGGIIRIGPYSPEAWRTLDLWPGRTATIFICEDTWDRAPQMLAPDADVDCLCRPFARSELLWRAERAFCRLRAFRQGCRRTCLQIGPMRYDPKLCEVRVGNSMIHFRRAEREIMLHLLRHPDRYVTTAELQEAVLGSHGNGGAVRTQIYEIRRKLARVGVGTTILCEPRKGYRLLSTDDSLG